MEFSYLLIPTSNIMTHQEQPASLASYEVKTNEQFYKYFISEYLNEPLISQKLYFMKTQRLDP